MSHPFKVMLCGLCVVFLFVGSAFADQEARAGTEVTTEKVSLEFQGVNILDVLKLLSKRSGLNIVAGRNVQGQVSIFLQDVEVMDALATILETSDLAYVTERGIIKVMTKKDYEELTGKIYQDTRVTKQFTLEHAKAEPISQTLVQMKSATGRILVETRTNTIVITEKPDILSDMEELIKQSDQPSVSRVYRLKYAKAEDLEPKLAKLMSDRQGSFEIDKKSNRVFVSDTPDRVDAIGRMVEAFDVRQPQVLIQAKVIEVKLDDHFRFGINWQLVAEKLGSLSGLQTAAAYTVAPPAGAALTALTLGGGADDLQVVINILETMGKTNTLSAPRLAVLNQEEAKLAVATREPFVSQTVVQSVNTATTADNVQFVDVGVTLKVTPSISEDGIIQMKIKPEVSTTGTPLELQGVAQGSNTAFTRTRVPVVTTQELETTVAVQSGMTLIIGGLIQDRQDKQMSKLPVLGNIPVIGRVFSSKVNDFTKTELVVFLTPTLMRPDEPSLETGKYFDWSGRVRPHRETGGYDFKEAYVHSQHPFSTEDRPYWEPLGSSEALHAEKAA